MTASNSEAHPESDHGDAARDHRELSRTVLMNAVGYGIKAGHPLLFFVVAALYGREALGLFFFAELALFLTMRTALLGLDKSMLWWLPQRPAGEELHGFAPALRLSLVLGAALTLLLAFGLAYPIARLWNHGDEAAIVLQVASLGLVPMVAMEMWVAATLARRDLKAQVLIKDGLVPMSQVVVAVLAYFVFGKSPLLLAGVFAVSQFVGAGLSYRMYRRVYRDALAAQPHESTEAGFALPENLRRYTLPLWASELNASLVLRVDGLLVGLLAGPAVLGVYGVVVKIANAVRSIRRSFDPIVWAMVSKISVRPDNERLKSAFSYATVLTLASQMPIFAFLMAFAPELFARLGGGYEEGAVAVVIFCGFWVINGLVGLNGLIVAGYGRSGLVLANSLGTLAIEVALLFLLVPPFGVEGAAVAAGGAYTAQNVVQAIQARMITGMWPYRRDVVFVVGAFVLGGIAAVIASSLSQGMDDVLSRGLALGVFVVASGALCYVLRERGLAFRLTTAAATVG